MVKKVKKRRLNLKRTLVLVLFIYIAWYMINYLVTSPIKHIEVSGNTIVKDSEIIKVAKLKDYPAIMKYSNSTIENNIKRIDLIEDVEVNKKIGNILSIKIKEKKVLFYFKTIDKIVLSDGTIKENNIKDIYGIPTLVNSIDEEILKEFVKGFNTLNNQIIYEINEIEYYPKYGSKNELINNERFKIIMNDGNEVIVNVNTISVLNKYNDIYSSLNGVKGTIDLDSNKTTNLVFTPFEE